MQSPGCTLIGGCVGRHDVPKAYAYNKVILIIFGIFLAFETTSIYVFQNDIINFMTNHVELRECLSAIMFMFIITVVPNGIRGSLRG